MGYFSSYFIITNMKMARKIVLDQLWVYKYTELTLVMCCQKLVTVILKYRRKPDRQHFGDPDFHIYEH